MKNLTNVITDFTALYNSYTLREGFPFTSITIPSNIYDAILIKPHGSTSFSPRFPDFQFSIEDYVDFVNQYHLEKALVIHDNLDFLRDCPSLKYLTIVPSDTAGNNFDFSPLYEHSEILYLNCHTEYGLNFMNHTSIDYSKTNGVLRLDLANDGHLNSDCVDTLKTLSVSYSKERDLTKLFSSAELDSLQIVSSSIKSLNGINQSQKIQCLDLNTNKQLEDISQLEDVRATLKYLSIDNCAKIKDFSVISKLDQLEFLSLYGSNSLPSLDFLKNLKHLKVFGFSMNIVDGDLTPCLSLPHAYCAKGKKHYNLKNSDLPHNSHNSDSGLDGIDAWRQIK